jgi:hypothetical protein
MKRLFFLGIFALFFAAGCASDADKASWEELKKDWRGDNMKMRGM